MISMLLVIHENWLNACDFNLPKVDWCTNSGPVDAVHSVILAFVVECSF